MLKDIEKIITEYETAVAKMIIYCLEELPFPLGTEKTAGVLKGSQSSFVLKYELYNLSSFSVLSMYSYDEIKQIIDLLVEKNILFIEPIHLNSNMPVLRLSERGKSFLEDLCTEKVGFMDRFINREIPEFQGDDIILFNKLRLLRHSMALRMGIPAYTICGDIVLREIARLRPCDRSSMMAVRGVGERFVEKYGDEFISTIEIHDNLNKSNA